MIDRMMAIETIENMTIDHVPHTEYEQVMDLGYNNAIRDVLEVLTNQPAVEEK